MVSSKENRLLTTRTKITIEVKFPGADYQLPSQRGGKCNDSYPHHNDLQVQSKARVKGLVVIKGTLIEDKTLVPVKNQQIGLTINRTTAWG